MSLNPWCAYYHEYSIASCWHSFIKSQKHMVTLYSSSNFWHFFLVLQGVKDKLNQVARSIGGQTSTSGICWITSLNFSHGNIQQNNIYLRVFALIDFFFSFLLQTPNSTRYWILMPLPVPPHFPIKQFFASSYWQYHCISYDGRLSRLYVCIFLTNMTWLLKEKN